MPWTYNAIDYAGTKIGSLYGVLTYISEYRSITSAQLEDIRGLKLRYEKQRYVTPDDLKMVFSMISDTKDLKKKKTVAKKKTKKGRG